MPNSDWQTWLGNVRNWQAPSQTDFEAQIGDDADLQDKARAWLTRMFTDTNAEAFLSPFYTRMMKRNAIRPYLQEGLLAGSEYGTTPNNYGEFLKNWMTMGQGGWGNVGDMTGRMNQLLGRISQGRQDNRSNLTTPNAAMANAWYQNPELLTTVMGMLSTGMFANYERNKLREFRERFESMSPEQMNSEDWISYMLQRMPGMGLNYGG